MGDIYPYGPPHVYPRSQVYGWIASLNGPHPDPDIFTAIAEAESGFDAAVIFDNPPTEDYSVGIWQINYFGDLYSGRVAQFGTPKQLIEGGLGAQAYAAVTIWQEQGYGAWGSYDNGSYQQYLAGPPPVNPGVAPGEKRQPPGEPPSPSSDSWDLNVSQAASSVAAYGQLSIKYSRLIDAA